MNVAITGHRPERLTDVPRVCNTLVEKFEDLGAYRVIQGMAPGADLLAAVVALEMEIPMVAARPYPSFRSYIEKNNADWLGFYDEVWAKAEEAVDVSDSFCGKGVFQIRNVWMVDRADVVVAIWDGEEKGGTWNTVKYARKIGKQVEVIAP